jgi:hypothetical protein
LIKEAEVKTHKYTQRLKDTIKGMFGQYFTTTRRIKSNTERVEDDGQLDGTDRQIGRDRQTDRRADGQGKQTETDRRTRQTDR